MINIRDFDPKLLKSSMDVCIYYTGYVTKNPEYSINSVHPLYLLIAKLDRFVERSSRYLNIALAGSNNEVLKNMKKFGMELKIKLKKINKGLVEEYRKDYMKIKFDSDDDLSLNKILKFCIFTIIIRNVFEKDGKYYPQIFLDDCLYEI